MRTPRVRANGRLREMTVRDYEQSFGIVRMWSYEIERPLDIVGEWTIVAELSDGQFSEFSGEEGRLYGRRESSVQEIVSRFDQQIRDRDRHRATSSGW